MSFFNLKVALNKNLLTFGNLLKETMQIRNYAARKGYRMKRQREKVKQVEEKKVFIPHNLRDREKMLATRPKRKFNDSWKVARPIDNVFRLHFYQQKVNSFAEAVQCHRETHHPDIFNAPNEFLHVDVELNMQGEKKTRFLDDFVRVAPMPHKFEHGEERLIVVFGKDPEVLEGALKAGAQLTGGIELIKKIQAGQFSIQDFHYILAHPDILPELVQLRGLMRRKFPNPKNGTLGVDLDKMVTRFINGVSYQAKKDEFEKDFGLIETRIGTLDMKTEDLEENLSSLIKDVWQMKPKRSGDFISRVLLWSPPSIEKLKVDYKLYLGEVKEDKYESDEEDEKENERLAL